MKRSIFQKLLASHLSIGMGTVLLVAYLCYRFSKDALIERTFAQLSSINSLKQYQIEDYFERMRQNAQLLARNSPVLDLFRTSSTDTAAVNTQFALLRQEFAYQDLLVFDSTLRLLYHQAHSFYFPADTARQPLTERNFLKASLRGAQVGEINVLNGPVLLVSALVKNTLGNTVGVLLIRIPVSSLEYVLYLRTGIGQTGESYIVGADRRMRSHSRFFPGTPPETIEVRTWAVSKALLHKTTPHILTDYRGIPVLSAYHPLRIPGIQWVIISEIDLEEAMQPVYRMRKIIGIIGVGVCLLIAAVTWFVSAPLSRRIGRLRQVVLQLARGVLPKEPLTAGSGDEIGQMKEAINQLIEGLNRTSLFANEIGKGRLESFYEPLSPEDTLGLALVHMRDKLIASQEKVAMLNRQRTAALLEGEENERRRISRELHDGIGQLLTAVQFKINLIEGQEKERREIKSILDETITEVRRISHNLMPSVLLDFGLEAALKSLVNRTAQTTGLIVHLDFDTHPDAAPLSRELMIGLYRIVQEGMHNAVKYAQATQIDVIVDCEPEGVQLRLRDNGVGFDWQTYQQRTALETHGIRNMHERAHLLGGSFQLISQVGAGTTLTVLVPFTES